MNEVEWEASEDPGAMLAALDRGELIAGGRHLWYAPGSAQCSRKLRLFAVAVSRLGASRWPDFVAAQDGAEAMADGGPLCSSPYWVTAAEALSAAQQATKAPFATGGVKAALLRDLVVNPFRPVTLPSCRRCDGDGKAHGSDRPFEWTGPGTYPGPCPVCKGRKHDVPWLTPLALRLAESAYAERPGRLCGRCGGRGKRGLAGRYGQTFDRPPKGWGYMNNPCPDCHGTGRLDDGTLDPARLAVLADALEEAGCIGAPCPACGGINPRDVSKGARWSLYWCGQCDEWSRRLPHPLLAHLRSPGPHWRGCWALDLLLDKE